MSKLVQPFVEFYQVASFSGPGHKQPGPLKTAEGRLVLPLRLSAARGVCRQAIADLCWYVLDEDESRLLCQTAAQHGLLPDWPNQFDVVLTDDRLARTSIHVTGTVIGHGPVCKAYLRWQLKILTKRIGARAIRFRRMQAAAGGAAT